MKNKIHSKVLLIATLALFGASTTYAGAGHDHGEHAGHDHAAHGHLHDKQAGPNGGRLITSVEPHLEFFVTAERFVKVTFFDHDGKMIPVEDQIVSAIGGSRSAPTKIELVEKDGIFLSKEALPEMKNMPIVLSIKTTADSKPVRGRFYLNMEECSSCEYLEYACVCGH